LVSHPQGGTSHVSPQVLFWRYGYHVTAQADYTSSILKKWQEAVVKEFSSVLISTAHPRELR